MGLIIGISHTGPRWDSGYIQPSPHKIVCRHVFLFFSRMQDMVENWGNATATLITLQVGRDKSGKERNKNCLTGFLSGVVIPLILPKGGKRPL